MKIFLSIITLFNLSLNTVQSNNVESNNFLDTKFENTSKIINSWKNSNYKYIFKFKNNNEYFNLFKVKENNELKGYFILNEIGELETFYSGNCDNINFSDLTTLSPIFSSGVELEEESNDNINLIDSSTYFVPPVLNVDLYKTSFSSYHSEQLITGCPFYYNYSYGPVDNGCSPTTAAMLISFYDRYSELDNLLDKELPLNHEDDKENVDKLIIELANLMGTNKFRDGTSTTQIMSGYAQYLSNKGYYGFQPRLVSLYDDYSYIINTYKNPAHLNIHTANSNEGHSVLGVGTANVKGSGRFMVTHYDWYNKNTGDYYVSEKYFNECIYIGS